MPAGRLLGLPNPALDSNGKVISGSRLYFFLAGTDTPQPVYSDSTLETALGVYSEADSAGRFPQFWADASNVFDVVWKDALGATIKDFEGISALGAPDTTVTGTPRSDTAGVPADGTDQSDALQTFIDANKGKKLVIAKGTQFAGLLLSGSDYDNTHIVCDGETLLGVRATSDTNNFNSAWNGIILQACDGVRVDLDMNGQRSLQPAEEHAFCVGVYGATNYTITGTMREIRGDGIYVTNDPDQTLPAGVPFGNIDIEGSNSAVDGRNLVSLICMSSGKVHMRSHNIGGKIGSTVEPGGIDIEPNSAYQFVSNFDVEAYVYSDGGANGPNQGIGVHGMEVTDGERDYNVYNGRIRGKAIGTANPLNAFRFRDIDFDVEVGGTPDAPCSAAAVIDACDKVTGRIVSRYCSSGADIGLGYNGLTPGVHDYYVRHDVMDWYDHGVMTGSMSHAKLTGTVSRLNTALGTGNKMAVWTRDLNSIGSLTQDNVEYAIDVVDDGDASLTRGYRAGSTGSTQLITFTSVSVKNATIMPGGTYANALDSQFLAQGPTIINCTAPAASATASGGAATLHAEKGIIVTDNNSTAAGSDYTLTLTNIVIKASSIVKAYIGPLISGTINTTIPFTVIQTAVTAGQVVFTIRNGHASAALNGRSILAFHVEQP